MTREVGTSAGKTVAQPAVCPLRLVWILHEFRLILFGLATFVSLTMLILSTCVGLTIRSASRWDRQLKPGELVKLLKPCAYNPGRARKISLITRFGAEKVRELLPPLIKVVNDAGLNGKVIWVCDAMHGNTKSVMVDVGDSGTKKKFKTRSFDDVLSELKTTFEVHAENGSRLGGTHLEMTGERVTESQVGLKNCRMKTCPCDTRRTVIRD